jgi:hypothetical protein
MSEHVEKRFAHARRQKDTTMLKLGYKMMTEEHGPIALVRNVKRAEDAGFDFAAISDYFFPWLKRSRGIRRSPGPCSER